MFFEKTAVKKMWAVVLTIIIAFGLSGCTNTTKIVSGSFLSPPKPNGDMYYVQQALEESVEGNFILKYPTAGQYRSAYILADLIGSGKKDFAIAFYSLPSSENIVSLHLNLMKQVDEQWISISDVSVSATGVEKLILEDLDGDGISEIIVGWNIYGGVDKRVSVYDLKGVSLVPLMQENYTDFICCDLYDNGAENLFILNHNGNDGSAFVKLYGFEDEKVVQIGNCRIDGNVTSFYEPFVTRLAGGQPAVFIDAVKGNGTQTEILYIKDSYLTRVDISVSGGETLATYRNTAVICSDINNDGRSDIPLSDSSLAYTPESFGNSLADLVKWSSFDGVSFTVSMVAAMNYTDGYYLEIPTQWFGKITVEADVEYRMYTVSVWDTDEGIKKGELFKLRTVTDVEWDKENNGLEAYTEISRNGSLIYVAAVGNYAGAEQVKSDEIKSLVHIIGK